MLSRPLHAAIAVALGLHGLAAAQDCIVPASPTPIQQVQPDGTRILLRLKGRPGWIVHEDLDGFPVVLNEGRWEYARLRDTELVPSGLFVGRSDPLLGGIERDVVGTLEANRAAVGLPLAPRSGGSSTGTAGPIGPGHVHDRRPPRGGGAAFLSGAGSVTNLVVLLRFSDHGPGGQNRTLPTDADVDDIMNAVGGDPVLAPTGSVRDHYLETSYGQFTVDSTVAAWVTVPSSETYYANGSSGLTSRTWELIIDGLNLVDAFIDFSQFDQDGDGVIDAITFLHSGYGAEWGGTDSYGTSYVDRMWSHKWSIPGWTSGEGVSVFDYNISPGLWGTSGSSPGRIGVVTHELGHFFGLPDLYDTGGTGASSQGIGNWCLMAAGSWGFDSSQRNPSHLSAWSKLKLGWVEPERLLPGSHLAPQVETSPSIFMIDSGYPPGEYLLIENRQPTGFDAVIPQGGLAIWHVDETKGSFYFNDPNTDEGYPGQSGWPGNGRHYRVALLQADGGFDMERNSDRGDAGDIYHGAGTSDITGSSTPSTDAYQEGTILDNGNRVENVGLSGSSVSFDYAAPSAPSITTGSAPAGQPGNPYSLNLASSGGSGTKTWSETLDVPVYAVSDLGPQSFPTGGTAQGWKADEGIWEYVLPFDFPYYERTYDRVYVGSNGTIDFAPQQPEPGGSEHVLRANLRLAPLWDDLTTQGGGRDIYVDTSVGGQVRLRWRAETWSTGDVCNFAVVLYDDGRVEYQYGSGNTNLVPIVGLSRGQGCHFEVVASHSGQSSLTNASSILFTLQGTELPPGLTLSSGGVLSGTPTVGGTYSPRFRVTDSTYRYDEVELTIDIASFPDCNNNGTPDDQDISGGTSQDCNSNGVPDECEPDCDSDGVPDDCEVDCNSNGTPDDCEAGPDCNSNGIPDECEPDCDSDGVPDDCEVDCNSNGTPDDCEAGPDCNSNGIPDECEPDCDSDGVPDDCEVDCNSNGTPDDCEAGPDCNSNGIPDECEPDCDSDGVPDDCEVDCNSNGTPDDCEAITDCNTNGIPDECEPDCDSDGIPDDCEVDCNSNGTPDDCEAITDCNTNGVPDECEPDCDSDGIPDDCEVDCNSNGTPDECEAGPDCNANGIPDECEPDCDSDGIPDDCEVDCNSNGTPDDCEAITDCNTNGVPDECEPDCDSDGIPDDCEVDCNSNGTPDECEAITDCNSNGVPDECEPDCDSDGIPDDCEVDCNSNGTPDECEAITDCNSNGVPDECEPDCDSDGIPDDCEVDCNSNGTPDECEAITDCNSNGIPDECEPDCDSDGVPDDCEIDCNSNGTPDDCEAITDCNSNGVPDECEPDCDSDGIPDDCEVDCNSNGTPDECEAGPDCNANGIPDECEPDCDSDGIPDDCEVDCNSNGTPDDCEAITDCNTNGVPDECEPDCDSDGIPDDCEVDCNSNGTPDDCEAITDCNANGVPDECEPDCDSDGIPDDCEIDCNSNGTPDECEAITDCNSNGVPDECEPDCDSDGIPDDCEIDCNSNGTPDDCEAITDCNANGVPDECEPDCDSDGIPDDCEIDCNSNGTPDECEAITDCNSNGVPDECEPDCDSDGIPDDCEIDCNSNGTPDECEAGPDCNSNGIPDECEPDCDSDGIPDDCETDCNANGTPDDCEAGPDCNSNGIPDECDISAGTSTDADGDGVPDECAAAGAAFCLGDGSGTPCPCGNESASFPPAGCQNSFGSGASLIGLGNPQVTNDTVTLYGWGMPASTVALFFQGDTRQAGGAGNPFGDGLLCAGGTIIRLGARFTADGATTFPGDSTTISWNGQISAAGGVRTYQIWYRNSAPFCTASGFNVSNGYEIDWQP